MATPKALPEMIQMIDGKQNFKYDETLKFVEQLKGYSSANPYCTVISIIGPQSSGKSSLLNTLFGTNFKVLLQGNWEQTTQGMWIAKCINPCMIIMDVEGFDGMERGEDETVFERRAGLFALTVSDVLLLNMWFHDIRRQQGANIGLIKLIFKETVKIDAPQRKTKLIIVVRDYPYNQYQTDKTKEDLECTMNELWHEVHPAETNMNMSEYIEVIVQDFPNKFYEPEKFAKKSKDLAELLYNFAGSGSIEHNNCASGFAFSSERIWNLIFNNERVVAADHKLAMSFYMCSKIIKDIIDSLHKEEEYNDLIFDPKEKWYLMSDPKKKEYVMSVKSSIKEFNAKLMLLLKRIQSRYEEETSIFDVNIRNDKMNEMEKIIVEKLKEPYKQRVTELRDVLLSLARSDLRGKLEKLDTLEEDAIVKVVQDNYMKVFDDDAHSDCHPYNLKALKAVRGSFGFDLTKIAKKEAEDIQHKRNIKIGFKITAKVILGTVGAAAGLTVGAVGAGVLAGAAAVAVGVGALQTAVAAGAAGAFAGAVAGGVAGGASAAGAVDAMVDD